MKAAKEDYVKRVHELLGEPLWRYRNPGETGATDGPYPADYRNLNVGPRAKARGHLAGCQFGGSASDLRNLVPLHRDANSNIMSGIETKIANQIAGGQAVHYEVTRFTPQDRDSPADSYSGEGEPRHGRRLLRPEDCGLRADSTLL